MTKAVECGVWSMPRPGRFTPGKDSVHTVQEVGLAVGSVRMGFENHAPHRDSTPGLSILKPNLTHIKTHCTPSEGP